MSGRQLSERETAALTVIARNNQYGSTGSDLVHGMREVLGVIALGDVTLAGAHQTAASLCRKNLAWRSGTSKLQSYRITREGRKALAGDVSGSWIARKP